MYAIENVELNEALFDVLRFSFQLMTLDVVTNLTQTWKKHLACIPELVSLTWWR